MMASNKSPRLVADPSVGVADLVKVLDDYMVEKGETNLWKLIQPPSNASWKSAPPVGWLASLSTLFKRYCEVAPNTIVSGKKNKAAITRLCETKGVNHTRKTVEDFADMVDNSIRMGLGHYRTMKQQGDLKERAFRRADSAQQTAMENVLSIVNAQAAKDEQGESQGEQQGEAAETKETRMCLFQRDQPQPAQALDPAPAASSSKGTTFAVDVFDRVLCQSPAHSPSKDTEGETCYVDNVAIKILKRPATSISATQDSEDSPVKGPWVLKVDSPDQKLLQNVQGAEPLARNGKSQQQRLNATKPKKQKGKGKGIKGATAKQLPSKTGKATGKGKGEGKGKVKGSKMKKPSASQHAASRPGASQPPAAQFADESTKTSYDESYYIIPDQVPDPKTVDLKRVTARHRFVSKSYHDTRNSLEKQGVSTDDAKECGSAAARKAGQIFDAKWPREEVGNVQVSKGEKAVQNSKAVGEHASKKALNEVKKDTVIKKKKKEQSREKGANNTEEKIPKSRPNSNDENGNDDELDVW